MKAWICSENCRRGPSLARPLPKWSFACERSADSSLYRYPVGAGDTKGSERSKRTKRRFSGRAGPACWLKLWILFLRGPFLYNYDQFQSHRKLIGSELNTKGGENILVNQSRNILGYHVAVTTMPAAIVNGWCVVRQVSCQYASH